MVVVGLLGGLQETKHLSLWLERLDLTILELEMARMH